MRLWTLKIILADRLSNRRHFAMVDDVHCLEVAEGDREALVLCLALGTLEAMRGGAWPLEAGIWTLGRPLFWQSLAEAGSEAVKVLQAADELSALAKFGGRPAAEEALDRMIAVVRLRLAALPEKSWSARWSGGDSP